MRTPLLDGRIVAVPIFCPWRVDDVRVGGVCRLLRDQGCAVQPPFAAHRQNPAGLIKNRRIGITSFEIYGPFAGLPAAYSRARSKSQYAPRSIQYCRIGYPEVTILLAISFRLASSEHNPSTFSSDYIDALLQTTLPGNG